MEDLPQLLEGVPLAMQQTMSFMQDGAYAYFTNHIKQLLDSH
jgi:hypothetical protein